MTEPILNDLCLSLIDALQKAAKGLSNPTASEYHRIAWAKDAYKEAELALSTLISLGPLTTNPNAAPVRYTLEMPQGDSREAKVWWVDRNGDNVHLCISVDQLQPIPLESRVPGSDDLDERGRCWLRRKYEPDGPTWRLFAPASLFDGALQLYYKEWLPYHAIPHSQNPTQGL